MKLYLIIFDCQREYVEACTFGEAIELWRYHLIADNNPGDFDLNVEPESVELVHDEPVIRAVS